MGLISDVFILLFIVSTGILLYFYRFVFLKIEAVSVARNTETPPVSIVICAKNEEDNLRKFLPHILRQNYPVFEVVVVSDHSTDHTLELLLEMRKAHKNLSVYDYQEEKKSAGKKSALTYGIEKAKYDYLLMTDADCVPKSENWVALMMSGFHGGNDMVLGVGRYEVEDSRVNRWIQNDTWYIAIQYLSFALIGQPYMSVGRNVAYKKSLFKLVNGFENHLEVASGDDDLFVQEVRDKAKVGVVLHHASHTISVAKKTWKDFLFQKSRHLSTGFHYSKSSLLLLGFYQVMVLLWYFSIPVLLVLTEEWVTISTMVVLKMLVKFQVFKRIFTKLGITKYSVSSLFFDIMSIFVNSYAILFSKKSKKGVW